MDIPWPDDFSVDEMLAALAEYVAGSETDESIGALVEDDLERRYNQRFPYPPPDGWQPPET